jgi:hypothetical protein
MLGLAPCCCLCFCLLYELTLKLLCSSCNACFTSVRCVWQLICWSMWLVMVLYLVQWGRLLSKRRQVANGANLVHCWQLSASAAVATALVFITCWRVSCKQSGILSLRQQCGIRTRLPSTHSTSF